MAAREASFMLFLTLIFLIFLRFAEPVVPPQEVETVENILADMNATNWRFNGENCMLDMISQVPKPTEEANATITCECNIGNDTNCHVVSFIHKWYSLDGILSPELAKLPYLRSFDVAYNFLQGTIPREWGSSQMEEILILGNRITGEIPPELGNLTSLRNLDLEANYLSGTIPPQLGRLINLRSLILSSNQFTGRLTPALGQLVNLRNLINDCNFSGPIPDFIQNWRQVNRLHMVASGLTGPIPLNISLLDSLNDLRISDINGPPQLFPPLNRTTTLTRLILRNCNLFGEIPDYIWQLRDLTLLDASFNNLVGRISNNILQRSIRYVFLTSNMLSGDIPNNLLEVNGAAIDLSYNNFTWQEPNQPSCEQNRDRLVNLFRSSSTGNSIQDVRPCFEDIKCHRYACSLHINCGGDDVTIRENERSVLYKGDAIVDGGVANLYDSGKNWGFSSTGDFMDDAIFTNIGYIESLEGSTDLPTLYTTARLSPLTLTYFGYCLENGEYAVQLHFAEIKFTNDSTYRSHGRRIFDIYIQGRLVRRNFNIEDEAGGVSIPLVIMFNASVTDNILEIKFYWAGKGTTRFPTRGVYGPLISAIDVDPYFKTCSIGGKKTNIAVFIGVAVAVPCFVLLILFILWRRKCFKRQRTNDKDFEGMSLKTISFTYKQLKSATDNFSPSNKIGEGGFGPVYKGTLSDGTLIAVKKLSAQSRQGNREFLNEIGVISCLQHPNLVKLHGCCIEGDQLLLVYEYMENNSLASALFESSKSRLMMDWATRLKICIGIARGLAFLHEESRIKIVHRDIKATNILLDKDLNPKISDFGLARLHEDEKTHVSTRVAGTIGYMAPEYALWGYLSDKADVYSFGVLVLEIVSGKNNNSYIPTNDCICLLDWACRLETSKHYEELFDERLESGINKEEVETVVKVALLCTNGSSSMRPTMTEVVNMLDGKTCVPEIIPEASGYSEDLRFKAMRDFRRDMNGQNSSNGGQTQTTDTIPTGTNHSLSSSDDQFEMQIIDTRS
ncbi:probable LRR receptor-like serine/threonine-protein kinase RFK1 isoform X2 [Lactuca sativa]|uniref:probable LRR receptor-like serine/threonine-protein kinase RFK1 isoform X2 n=1 Tax=Lactuca sativa TaxID=4236 RepID=UPI000CD9E956|nr:probable LRR receptor-like serine/threonine-protein kinase RFK1 isoform X2 [Lactuca sativa]